MLLPCWRERQWPLVRVHFATGQVRRASVPGRVVPVLSLLSHRPSKWAELLHSEVDETVSSCPGEEFCTIADYYGDFSPVRDDEIKRLLVESCRLVW